MKPATSGAPLPQGGIARLIERPLFQNVILALILINAVTLGLETLPAVMAEYGAAIHLLDKAILSVFVAEIVLRLRDEIAELKRRPQSART